MEWEAHVDYLRYSIPADASAVDRQRIAGLRERGLAIQGGSYEAQRWCWQGYTGFKAGAVCWGVRGDGEFLQVSGRVASCVEKAELPRSGKCARVDLALTVQLEEDLQTRAQELYEALSAESRKQVGARKRKVHVHLSNGDGDTLYLGSRSSRAYGRVYDKGRESKGQYPLGTWRYEVEAHNEVASSYLPMVVEAQEPGQACLGLVHDWFKRRGVETPITPNGATSSRLHLEKVDREDWRWLRWIETQVRPGLQEHIDRLGKVAVYSALGLPLDE